MPTLLLLAHVVLAQPANVTYQVQTFLEDEGSGQLTPSELACLSAFLPVLHPGENEADLLGLKYVRNSADFGLVCLTFEVERAMGVSDFAALDAEPSGVWFSENGSTAYWNERLPVQCVTRGSVSALPACLVRLGDVPSRFTEVYVRRPDSTVPMVAQFIWETVTRSPSQYGVDRRSPDMRVRSHTKETPEPVEPSD